MMATIDFGKTAQDYGRYRHGFPAALFDRLAAFDVGLPGQRVLDLGTGTGTLARGFARRGCTVTGLDPAARRVRPTACSSPADAWSLPTTTGCPYPAMSSRRPSS